MSHRSSHVSNQRRQGTVSDQPQARRAAAREDQEARRRAQGRKDITNEDRREAGRVSSQTSRTLPPYLYETIRIRPRGAGCSKPSGRTSATGLAYFGAARSSL